MGGGGCDSVVESPSGGVANLLVLQTYWYLKYGLRCW